MKNISGERLLTSSATININHKLNDAHEVMHPFRAKVLHVNYFEVQNKTNKFDPSLLILNT